MTTRTRRRRLPAIPYHTWRRHAIAAVRGDIVGRIRLEVDVLAAIAEQNRRDRRGWKKRNYLYVVARCRAIPLGWLCLTCNQLLANDLQVEYHLARDRHVIAKLCAEHGAEALR